MFEDSCKQNGKIISDKTIIITGGAGFIGSNLVDLLSDKKLHNNINIIDNLSSGHLRNLNSLWVKEKKALFVNDNVSFIKMDIRDLSKIEILFQKLKPDYIFHLAAITSVQQSIIDPLITHDVNVTGTLNVLLASKDIKNLKKFVFSSSCAIYGNPDNEMIPIKEDLPPNPISPYAYSKLIGEQYCNLFNNMFNLPIVCLRFFNVYGPRQNSNSNYAAVIPKFINEAKKDKSIIIYGDGKQTRDFVHVYDIINANIIAATNDSFGTFNVGTNIETSIYDITEIIKRYYESDIDIKLKESRVGDISRSIGDITKIKKLGFFPRYKIDAGIQQLINYNDSSQLEFKIN